MKQAVADEIGRLIGAAFDARNAALPRRERMSQRDAATLAGIHESWWRALIQGGQRRGETFQPAKGSPETYVAMAKVVGLESEVRRLLGDEAPPETVGGRSDDADFVNLAPNDQDLRQMPLHDLFDIRDRVTAEIDRRARQAEPE